jgi:hypothetical protein
MEALAYLLTGSQCRDKRALPFDFLTIGRGLRAKNSQ